jgi:hypothetical protein
MGKPPFEDLQILVRIQREEATMVLTGHPEQANIARSCTRSPACCNSRVPFEQVFLIR